MRQTAYRRCVITSAAVIIFICAAVAGGGAPGARAQVGVLADGDPPLTSSMVEGLAGLFEWSLGVEFSTAERADLRRTLVGYWKAGDAKSIQSVGNMLAFERKLRTWGEAQKEEARPQLKRQLLEAIEADQADALNRLLLAVYRRGQGGDRAEGAPGEGGEGVAGLAGKWQFLHGNSLVSVDVPSGRIGDGNAMIAEYDIRPDGRVIFSFVMQQSNYGCTTRVKTSKTGRATADGSRITFRYDGGTTASEDSCNARYNYTKKLAPERESFDFGLKRDGGKTQLCIANEKLKDCAVKVR